MEEAFIRPRNITLARHVFLITKQLRGETVEHFYGKLKEFTERFDFENKEETLIRNVFITNVMDPEIQKELLKQTVKPLGIRANNYHGTWDSKPTSNSTA